MSKADELLRELFDARVAWINAVPGSEGRLTYAFATAGAYLNEKPHEPPMPDPHPDDHGRWNRPASPPHAAAEPEKPMDNSKYYALLDRFAPSKWRCTKCGCYWRLNPPWGEPYKPPLLGQRSWSLFDAEQKSCAVCDNSPEFLSAIEPAAAEPVGHPDIIVEELEVATKDPTLPQPIRALCGRASWRIQRLSAHLGYWTASPSAQPRDEQDAKRYRWLREFWIWADNVDAEGHPREKVAISGARTDGLDEIIDAAHKSAGKE